MHHVLRLHSRGGQNVWGQLVHGLKLLQKRRIPQGFDIVLEREQQWSFVVILHAVAFILAVLARHIILPSVLPVNSLAAPAHQQLIAFPDLLATRQLHVVITEKTAIEFSAADLFAGNTVERFSFEKVGSWSRVPAPGLGTKETGCLGVSGGNERALAGNARYRPRRRQQRH